MIKGMWLGIVGAANVIMALSGGRNHSEWLTLPALKLRGVFRTITPVGLFVTGRVLKISSVHWRGNKKSLRH